jgi:hypothetical protein
MEPQGALQRQAVPLASAGPVVTVNQLPRLGGDPGLAEETAMQLQVGDKIRTKGRLGIWHYGVYVGPRGPRGEDVVHNSKDRGAVVLEPLSTFAADKDVFIVRRTAPGYEEVAAQRALAHLGQNYDLLAFNCEHFVNVVHDGQRESPQLQVAGALAIGVPLFLALLSPSGKYDSNVGRYRDSQGRFVSR